MASNIIDPKLLADFERAAKALADSGASVVAIVVEYSEPSAYFKTFLLLKENAEAGINDDHIVLDAVREISNQWSDVRHNRFEHR